MVRNESYAALAAQLLAIEAGFRGANAEPGTTAATLAATVADATTAMAGNSDTRAAVTNSNSITDGGAEGSKGKFENLVAAARRVLKNDQV